MYLYGVPQQMVKIIQEIDATEIYEEQDEFDAFMSSDFEFE